MPYILESEWARVLRAIADAEALEPEIDRLSSDLAASQERVEKMREALEYIDEDATTLSEAQQVAAAAIRALKEQEPQS